MRQSLSAAGVAGLLLCVSACGPLDAAPSPEEPGQRAQALETLNGLSLNGLSLNGLSLNGLSLNGLSLNGLSAAEFDSWFQQDPSLNDTVMKYVVLCAAPAGVVRTYTSATTGQTWSWMGRLGLAPDWTQGAPATLTEQRLVSACLAAHANKYGVHIPISVLGQTALGADILVTQQEFTTFTEREGCFFGNLFNGEGLYVGNDAPPLQSNGSSPRACARMGVRDEDRQPCPPLVRLSVNCGDVCEKGDTQESYAHCTYNGITYPAITTRMRQQDVFRCGDGICQYTESCGTGNTPDNCKDCGPCP